MSWQRSLIYRFRRNGAVKLCREGQNEAELVRLMEQGYKKWRAWSAAAERGGAAQDDPCGRRRCKGSAAGAGCRNHLVRFG